MDDMNVKKWANDLYKKTEIEWQKVAEKNELVKHSKYEIFYSTPRFRAELMIIGENPGGNPFKVDKHGKNQSFDVPTWEHFFEPNFVHEYLKWEKCEDDYVTAQVARLIWRENLNMEQTLAQSVKLNINFFRSATRNEWKKVVEEFRLRLEKFSFDKVIEIVEFLKPKVIVTEGFLAFDSLSRHFKAKQLSLQSRANGKRQVAVSEFSDTILVGMVHSAARPRLGPVASKIPFSTNQKNEIQAISKVIKVAHERSSKKFV